MAMPSKNAVMLGKMQFPSGSGNNIVSGDDGGSGEFHYCLWWFVDKRDRFIG